MSFGTGSNWCHFQIGLFAAAYVPAATTYCFTLKHTVHVLQARAQFLSNLLL